MAAPANAKKGYALTSSYEPDEEEADLFDEVQISEDTSIQMSQEAFKNIPTKSMKVGRSTGNGSVLTDFKLEGWSRVMFKLIVLVAAIGLALVLLSLRDSIAESVSGEEEIIPAELAAGGTDMAGAEVAVPGGR